MGRNTNKNITAIRKLAYLGKYQEAASIADEVRWGRVKDVKLLNLVSDVYEKCERYHDAKRVMMIVYSRVDSNKRMAYKLCELSAKAGDMADAEEFYWEFSDLSPKDPEKLILAYYIMCASGEPDSKKIEALESYIRADFDDKWAYKLAQLYYRTGQTEKCVRICDELILWYSGDHYGEAALRLKHKCLGIKDVVMQTKSKPGVMDEVTATAEEPSEDDMSEQVYEDSLARKNVAEAVANEDTRNISGYNKDDKPTLWFNLKEFNKDIIVGESKNDSEEVTNNQAFEETSDVDFNDENTVYEEVDTIEEVEDEAGIDDTIYTAGVASIACTVDDIADEPLYETEDFVEEAALEEMKEFGATVEKASEEKEHLVEATVTVAEEASETVTEDIEEYIYVEEIEAVEAAVKEVEDVLKAVDISDAEDAECINIVDEIEAVEEEAVNEVEVVKEENETASEADEESVEESFEIEAEETPYETIEDWKNSGIILETSTEREKVFVFNQTVLQDIEENPAEDDVSDRIEFTEEIDESEAAQHMEDVGIFIDVDVADGDDSTNSTEEIFTEEIFVEAPEESNDNVDMFVKEASEHIKEAAEPENNESSEETDTAETDEYPAEADEQVTDSVLEAAEESALEEEVYAKKEDTDVAEAEQPSEKADLSDTVVEDSISDKKSEDNAVTSKTDTVGYIDNNNTFTKTEEPVVSEDKADSKKSTNNVISEKQGSEKKTAATRSNGIRVLLMECSQMKGGVKYAANKLQSIHQQEETKLHGIAKITDEKFTLRGASDAISVLRGRDLVVEGVDRLTYDGVSDLMDVVRESKKSVMIALVDTPVRLALFVNKHRRFAEMCEYVYEEACVSRREFLNYINNYAYKLNAVLDDMAEEELEYIADEMIEDGIAFTISDAALLVEKAIERAEKPGLKGLFEAKKDAEGYLILRARHFDRG